MGMTRATFFVTAALVVALVVGAAGIGAYLAVRHSARPTDGAIADQAAAGRMGLAIHEPGGPSAASVSGPAAGIAVETTEQTIEPALVAESGVDQPATEEQPALETPRARRAPTSPRRRPAARPPAPAPAPPPPPRPARGDADRPAPRPAPAAAPPRAEPEPAPDAPVPRPPARADRDLPVVDGWRPADPEVVDSGAQARSGALARNLPPLPAVNPDPPTSGRDAEPPLPATEELVVPADSVIGLQIDSFVTTDRAQVEDDVQARVTRDVMVSRRIAIPAGSVVSGSVVMVERAGQLRGTARLGVRFHTVVFDDGVEVPIVTETVYREGGSRGRDNAAKIGGGAVAGAILGAIFGGGRGAAIGGAAGAAGGTAAAAAGDAEPATLAAGTTLTVRLSRPVSVTVEQ